MSTCKPTPVARVVGLDPAGPGLCFTATMLLLETGELMYEQTSVASANDAIATYMKAARSAWTESDLNYLRQATEFWQRLSQTKKDIRKLSF